MEHSTSKRRLLQVGATGTALALAGCSALEDGTDTVDSESLEVTVSAAFSDEEIEEAQEALEEREAEIEAAVEDGELDEEEAQIAIQEAQIEIERELLIEVTEGLETMIAETNELTLSDSEPELGLVLAAGDAESLIGLLSDDSVAGLFPETEFEDQVAQQDPAGE